MFSGRVLGPDGKPLAGARCFDLNGRFRWEQGMKTAEFTRWFNPRRPREALLQHPAKGLIGVVRPPKENGGSVTVRMEPAAALRGRLVDAGGRPRAGAELEVTFHPNGWGSWFNYSPEPVQTDREGRFRIEGLVPGYDFRLSDGMGNLNLGGAFRSGQTKDLGDVQMKRD